MSTNVAEINSPDFLNPTTPPKVFGIDPRFVMPILITLILLIGELFYGILTSFPQTLTAIGASVLFEIVLSKIYHGKLPHLASAYISGISVGILTRSPDIYWTFALCAAISIASKYAIRFKGRHIFNPSNFGICVMLLAAPSFYYTLSFEWGNNLYAMLIIWTVGSIILYRFNRFHISLTYVLSFLALAGLRSLWTGDSFLAEISPITGPMYQLFIFFMITDPKTTIKGSKFGQCFVVFLVAVVEMILRLNENIHAPYFALFIVAPITNLIDIYWLSNKDKKT
jgi:Na+-translocating ferredoxin:NAD+ oxidoreductase RnfD subunit